MAYTFSGSRYITSGVAENFPISVHFTERTFLLRLYVRPLILFLKRISQGFRTIRLCSIFKMLFHCTLLCRATFTLYHTFYLLSTPFLKFFQKSFLTSDLFRVF